MIFESKVMVDNLTCPKKVLSDKTIHSYFNERQSDQNSGKVIVNSKVQKSKSEVNFRSWHKQRRFVIHISMQQQETFVLVCLINVDNVFLDMEKILDLSTFIDNCQSVFFSPAKRGYYIQYLSSFQYAFLHLLVSIADVIVPNDLPFMHQL